MASPLPQVIHEEQTKAQHRYFVVVFAHFFGSIFLFFEWRLRLEFTRNFVRLPS